MTILIKEASSEENQRLQETLTDYNMSIVKDFPRPQRQRIDLMAWTNSGEWIGGINAQCVNWGICFIDLLFIQGAFRNMGYGSQLLKEAEKQARTQGCYLAHLDTFDFQGKDFYLKNGYSIFGILDNCPRGHKRYFLKKDLTV